MQSTFGGTAASAAALLFLAFTFAVSSFLAAFRALFDMPPYRLSVFPNSSFRVYAPRFRFCASFRFARFFLSSFWLHRRQPAGHHHGGVYSVSAAATISTSTPEGAVEGAVEGAGRGGGGGGEGADNAGGSGGGAPRPTLLVQVWFSAAAAIK